MIGKKVEENDGNSNSTNSYKILNQKIVQVYSMKNGSSPSEGFETHTSEEILKGEFSLFELLN